MGDEDTNQNVASRDVSIQSTSKESEMSHDSLEPEDTDDEDYVAPAQLDEEPPETVRKSQRQPRPKILEDFVSYMCTEDTVLDYDPITVSEALSRPDKGKWMQAAMREELESFEENDAWELVDIPKSDSIVECKWVFKRKSDSDNNVRFRARLVAMGFSQRFGIDFDETFSLVVRHSTLRLLNALSVKFDLFIAHLDVATAFLNGLLDKNVYRVEKESGNALFSAVIRDTEKLFK